MVRNMEKTELGWCYFDDGTVEEIQSWHQFGDDIVFTVKGQVYLFKYAYFDEDIEEAELRRMLRKSNEIILPTYSFYKHRARESVWPVGFYDKIRNDRDEWFVADIEKICLYMGEIV